MCQSADLIARSNATLSCRGLQCIVAFMNPDFDDFYRAIISDLADHAYKGGTATGAAQVVKNCASGFGVHVEMVAMPRLTRAELEAAKEDMSGEHARQRRAKRYADDVLAAAIEEVIGATVDHVLRVVREADERRSAAVRPGGSRRARPRSAPKSLPAGELQPQPL